MNIYFAGSIRGGRDDAELYFQIIEYIKKYGTVLTEHIGSTTLTSFGEDTSDKDKRIHDRDMEWVQAADVIVAEVSTASLGVGYEIGRGVEMGKRILCLYRPQEGKRLSAMIAGSAGLTAKTYTDLEEAKKHIDEFFSVTTTPILVTAGVNPDLDGVSGVIAYAEFLTRNNTPAHPAFFGMPDREAEYMLKVCDRKADGAHSPITAEEQIILVDTSELASLSPDISPLKVIEIIDHRKIHEAEAFPNAKIQIELVGSAATLIAEKFHATSTPISPEAALLLYTAIVSNTINFKAKVTTQRDRDMADWLQTQCEVPETCVHDMFAYKSEIIQPLKDIFLSDVIIFSFNGYTSSIIQFETIHMDAFIQTHLLEIQTIFETFRTENNLDVFFLTCIDVEKGYNCIIATDTTTQNYLEQALDIQFVNTIATTNDVVMRKEMVPLIKALLEGLPPKE